MAAQQLPVTPPSATGTGTNVQIIDRTAEDEGSAFVIVGGTGIPDSVQDKAWKPFEAISSPNANVVDTRPRDSEGNLIHDGVDTDSATSRKGA